MQKRKLVHIVGGGLAGSEAAYQALRAGHAVKLYEMRPQQLTPAHQTGDLAELVCSNSLKSTLQDSAPGLLKEEMAAFDSLIIKAAWKAQVPAGNALAVERRRFSQEISQCLEAFEGFERVHQCVETLPAAQAGEVWIVASGPLTAEPLWTNLKSFIGDNGEKMHFYDAIAPVLDRESLDEDALFVADRYGETGQGDYFNLALNQEQYEAFIDAVMSAEKMPLHEFEDIRYFESCLPIEVMIERGRETLRFGPMKPVGLTDPKTGRWPYAAIQLRRENAEGSMLSMVGFQTKMKWPEQKRVFQTLPGMQDVEFFRYGSIHRNSYLESPKLLQANLSFRQAGHVFLAGQLTGVEGYTESAALGLLAGRMASAALQDRQFPAPPPDSMLGALYHYVTVGGLGHFQPMNANLGLLPPAPKRKGQGKAERKSVQCQRARQSFQRYRNEFFSPVLSQGADHAPSSI